MEIALWVAGYLVIGAIVEGITIRITEHKMESGMVLAAILLWPIFATVMLLGVIVGFVAGD